MYMYVCVYYIYTYHQAHGSVRFQTVSIEDGSVQTVRFLFLTRFGSNHDDHDDNDGNNDENGGKNHGSNNENDQGTNEDDHNHDDIVKTLRECAS